MDLVYKSISLLLGICINKIMGNYRKIWENANGPIPLDENNITFEIHHINGDRTINTLDNLMCLSILEHYNVHLNQGDWRACMLISLRLNDPIKYKMVKECNRKQIQQYQQMLVKNGTHHLLKRADGSSIGGDTNKTRVANGTHNFLDKVEASRQNNIRVTNGTHNLLKKADGSSIGGDSCKQRITACTHHFQNSKSQRKLSMIAKKVNQKIVQQICPVTGNIINEYISVQDLLRLNASYKSTIYRKINSYKLYKGFIWKYKN